MSIETQTVESVQRALLTLADSWLDGEELDSVISNEVAEAFSNPEAKHSLSLRDWAMAQLILKFDSPSLAVDFYTDFLEVINSEYSAPILTIQGVLWYSLNEMARSAVCIEKALESRPDYGLAVLIARVQRQQWPSESIQKMFFELHPKVCASLEEVKEELVMG